MTYGETMLHRVQETALEELHSAVEITPEPLAILCIQPGGQMAPCYEMDTIDPRRIGLYASKPITQQTPITIPLGAIVCKLGIYLLFLTQPLRIASVHPGYDKINRMFFHDSNFSRPVHGHDSPIDSVEVLRNMSRQPVIKPIPLSPLQELHWFELRLYQIFLSNVRSISIHSPLAGRDEYPEFSEALSEDFNPLAPRGARPFHRCCDRPLVYFNPLAPRGARHYP